MGLYVCKPNFPIAFSQQTMVYNTVTKKLYVSISQVVVDGG